jgi:O-antigen/teichoic acid export membrane protein
MVANSAISIGAIAASGFSDANIRYVATQRASGSHEALCRAVRSTLGIHLTLGCLLAAAGWLLAPVMTARLVAADSGLRTDCLWSLRTACLLLLLRAVESVCISTQRAFERYGPAVRVSAAARLLSLAGAGAIPLARPSVTAVLIFACGISLLSVWLQMASVARLLEIRWVIPGFDREAMRSLVGFGKFTWLQALSALLLGQVDRLVTGAALGAAAVSSYAMCVQLAQPVYGITAAGFHFLFPRISMQYVMNDERNMRRTMLTAVALNWVAVAAGTAVLLVFGSQILRAWGGNEIANLGRPVLPIVLCSTAISALSITGCYGMLAMGRVRLVTWLNLLAAGLMVAAMFRLIPAYGVRGMAIARLVYGPITLGVYVPLFLRFIRGTWLREKPARRPALLEEA